MTLRINRKKETVLLEIRSRVQEPSTAARQNQLSRWHINGRIIDIESTGD
jgi:hypothetical protein